MLKHALMAAAITLGVSSAQADGLLVEGFDDISTFAGDGGWVFKNLSTPVGSTEWFQGDASVFEAKSGEANSYIAANFNSAAAGGEINNSLISPKFSTQADGTISFWARSAGDSTGAFADTLSYSLVSENGQALSFSSGTQLTLTDTWTLYSVGFAAQGAASLGRLAFNYFGAADASNYIGIDSLSIDTVAPVPEPSTWLLMSVGLAGMGLFARRRKS